MDLIGGAWTPNILWHLKTPMRFGELKDAVGPISAKVLTQRLRRLEKDGLIRRTVTPSSPPAVEYSLTEFGREIKPAIRAILKVGERLKRRRSTAREN
jgi:DNA-binding HxlR family transcriptional regulator